MKKSIGKKLFSATLLMLLMVMMMSFGYIWSVHVVGKSGDIILNTSTYICLIQDLRLSFEKILMPPHDYLIYGKEEELKNFDHKIKNLRLNLDKTFEIIGRNKSEWTEEKKMALNKTKEGIAIIDQLARELLSIEDPLGIGAGNLMKKMDAKTGIVKKDLSRLNEIVSQDKNSKIQDKLYEFIISFQDILMPPHDYLILGDKIEKENFKILLPVLNSRIERILELSRPGLEQESMGKIKRDFEEVTDLAQQILSINDPLMLEAAEKMKRMDAASDNVIVELDNLLKNLRNDMEEDKRKGDRIKSVAIHFSIIISLCLVIASLVGGLTFSSNITEPVRQLLQATQRISAGDLTRKAEVITNDEIGELAISFNLMTDDLRNYQEELINAKEYIDNIIKSMIDTLIVMNPDGTIHTVNQATLKLLKHAKEEELVGKPIEIVIKDSSLLQGTKRDELLKKGSLRDYNAIYKTKDSIDIPMNLSASVIRDKEGKILGIVLVARDMREIRKLINDLKKAYKDLQATQAQLIQSSRLASLGVLAAGVAHEINNPMNIIINYADLLEDELKGNVEYYRYVQGILKEGERITNIVKNLLTFARADKQNHSPCHITDIINNSLYFMEAYLEKEAIKIETSFSPNLPPIIAKSSQLEQVFINLILNARDALNDKYSGPNPKKLILIEVKMIEKQGIDYIRTCFTDYGNGIAEKDLDKIFDPFFTTKGVGKGTGLGLSISYGIITDHKGYIDVKSREKGYTTFIIDLPTQEAWSKLEG